MNIHISYIHDYCDDQNCDQIANRPLLMKKTTKLFIWCEFVAEFIVHLLSRTNFSFVLQEREEDNGSRAHST